MIDIKTVAEIFNTYFIALVKNLVWNREPIKSHISNGISNSLFLSLFFEENFFFGNSWFNKNFNSGFLKYFLSEDTFPPILKNRITQLVSEKGYKNEKPIYWSIALLSDLSNIVEKAYCLKLCWSSATAENNFLNNDVVQTDDFLLIDLYEYIVHQNN